MVSEAQRDENLGLSASIFLGHRRRPMLSEESVAFVLQLLRSPSVEFHGFSLGLSLNRWAAQSKLAYSAYVRSSWVELNTE